MLLAGDEHGHSQQGNNNAYCRDNAITWLDWATADDALTDYRSARSVYANKSLPCSKTAGGRRVTAACSG